MALFNLPWPGRAARDDAKGRRSRRAVTAESAEVLRRRARHRLIGAAVLVLAGVVGFPVLFDTQPRPVPVDIPITIPDRNQAPALVLPAPRAEAVAPPNPVRPPEAPVGSVAPPAAPALGPAASGVAPVPRASNAGLDEGEEVVTPNSASRKPPAQVLPGPDATKNVAKPKPEAAAVKADTAKAERKPAVVPERIDEAARARALLEGQPVPAAPTPPAVAATEPGTAAAESPRFVVQVGAFGDTAKAQEARARLERSGLKTYVQSVDTKDGKRHRVRVGPFASRAEADKAAARIKGLDLPASVLTL